MAWQDVSALCVPLSKPANVFRKEGMIPTVPPPSLLDDELYLDLSKALPS